jgi:hypothetical protein
MSPFKSGSVTRRLRGSARFGNLALVCAWAVSGLAAAGLAVWFGFDIGAVLGITG